MVQSVEKQAHTNKITVTYRSLSFCLLRSFTPSNKWIPDRPCSDRLQSNKFFAKEKTSPRAKHFHYSNRITPFSYVTASEKFINKSSSYFLGLLRNIINFA